MEPMDEKDDSTVLWLSGRSGCCGPGEAARLVRQSRAENGLTPWPGMETDCFQAGDQLLILARPTPPKPHGFYFPDLEALLRAVAVCPPRESSLYAAKEGYLLVFPQKPELLPLYEFGLEYPLSPDWETHAREQKQCLIPAKAMENLLLVFSTKGM